MVTETLTVRIDLIDHLQITEGLIVQIGQMLTDQTVQTDQVTITTDQIVQIDQVTITTDQTDLIVHQQTIEGQTDQVVMVEFMFQREDGTVTDNIDVIELTDIDQTGIDQITDTQDILTFLIEDIKTTPEDTFVFVTIITLCLTDTFTGTLG